ncbi:helix-turn-helix domain-containing protein [Corticicoccus populi]|uniref:Helix-turn-helix domain-containing protein n=1 Tax=Corticicoccus populi TaxID=1812821 RepID=A0ABW5WZ04_9STAP
MARHRSFEEKIQIVEYYLKNGNQKTTVQHFDISRTTLNQWVLMYQEKGPEALKIRRCHHTYASGFKAMVATEYLSTDIDYSALARKYNIRSHETVRKWVIAYTGGKKLKPTFGGTQSMMKSRKTTYEERLKIAQYHEAHEISIRELSELFEVSYQQAYKLVFQ